MEAVAAPMHNAGAWGDFRTPLSVPHALLRPPQTGLTSGRMSPHSHSHTWALAWASDSVSSEPHGEADGAAAPGLHSASHCPPHYRRGIFITGSTIQSAAIRSPRIRSKNLISVVFCEATAIYGVIMAIILMNKVRHLPPSHAAHMHLACLSQVAIAQEHVVDGVYSPDYDFSQFSYAGACLASRRPGRRTHTSPTSFTGYAVFASGLTVGLSNLASGVCVGIAGSSCALADAADGSLFMKVIVVQIFGSALGIFGMIVGMIQANHADFPV